MTLNAVLRSDQRITFRLDSLHLRWPSTIDTINVGKYQWNTCILWISSAAFDKKHCITFNMIWGPTANHYALRSQNQVLFDMEVAAGLCLVSTPNGCWLAKHLKWITTVGWTLKQKYMDGESFLHRRVRNVLGSPPLFKRILYYINCDSS